VGRNGNFTVPQISRLVIFLHTSYFVAIFELLSRVCPLGESIPWPVKKWEVLLVTICQGQDRLQSTGALAIVREAKLPKVTFIGARDQKQFHFLYFTFTAPMTWKLNKYFGWLVTCTGFCFKNWLILITRHMNLPNKLYFGIICTINSISVYARKIASQPICWIFFKLRSHRRCSSAWCDNDACRMREPKLLHTLSPKNTGCLVGIKYSSNCALVIVDYLTGIVLCFNKRRFWDI